MCSLGPHFLNSCRASAHTLKRTCFFVPFFPVVAQNDSKSSLDYCKVDIEYALNSCDSAIDMDGEMRSSVLVVSTTLQTRDVATTFGANNNVAAPQTVADPPPPYDTRTLPTQDEIAIDASLAPGQTDSLEGSRGDRKRTRIYDSLLEEANSSATEHVVPGIINMPSHSNGWYDNCFTRSCVCDYTGRHVIPEYITSGSLYRGRVLGWKIFREIVLPLMNDIFRIIWTILQLIGAMLLAIFSVININGKPDLLAIIRLSFSSLALLLAAVDLCAVIIQKVIKCSTTNRQYTQFHNVVEDVEDADALAAEDATNAINHNTTQRMIPGCAGGKQWAKFSNTDIARLIIPELLLVPIVICDVLNYAFVTGKGNSKLTELIGLLLSISILALEVYLVRLVLLSVMTYRMHTKRSLPKQLNLTREAIVSAGYDPTIRRNGLIYLSFLIFNVVTHIVNQIAMIVAIGVQNSNYTVPRLTLFHFWFMIIAGYILPVVGVWLFFSVTHYWLQEFAIGITIDYLSILKLPGADRLFFPNSAPHEAQEKANKILLYGKYGTLRRDYHALRNENPLVKAWYPFKSFSHTLICLAYTTVQAIFIFVAATSIQGEQLNMGIFLFVIITEVLSNVYVLLVALFWIFIAALFLAVILLVLGVSVKCIICIAICCGSMFDTSRGPPQPPVMTPQIRAGLEQV